MSQDMPPCKYVKMDKNGPEWMTKQSNSKFRNLGFLFARMMVIIIIGFDMFNIIIWGIISKNNKTANDILIEIIV